MIFTESNKDGQPCWLRNEPLYDEETGAKSTAYAWRAKFQENTRLAPTISPDPDHKLLVLVHKSSSNNDGICPKGLSGQDV